MIVWLVGFKAITEAELHDEIFKKDLVNYLESIIKEGYLDDAQSVPQVDVSEISLRRPIDPSTEDFSEDFSDVNQLVKVANTYRHSFTCYKYGKNVDLGFCAIYIQKLLSQKMKLTLKEQAQL